MRKPQRDNGARHACDSHAVAYDSVLGDIATVIETARRSAARSVNCIMTAAYWLIGRRIVEFEQGGKERAEYGTELLGKLSSDLGNRYGRGFGVDNLQRFRMFYLSYPPDWIYATLSRISAWGDSSGNYATPSRNFPIEGSVESESIEHNTVSEALITAPKNGSLAVDPMALAACFPLPWSAYVRLLCVKNELARKFYEAETLRGGWSVRQLDRQIDSQFYERTALSRDKAAMLRKTEKPWLRNTAPLSPAKRNSPLKSNGRVFPVIVYVTPQ